MTISVHSTSITDSCSIQSQRVKANGQIYKHSCTLVIGCEREYPVFGELQTILVTTEIIFQVSMYETTDYNHHYHGYTVRKNSETKLIPLQKLIDYVPLHTTYVARNI